MTDASFHYTLGAANDEESWSSHLTPLLFWKHVEQQLRLYLTQDEPDDLIDAIVGQA